MRQGIQHAWAMAVCLAAVLAAGAAQAETPLDRGTYLVRGVAGCGNCHTPKDAEGKPIKGKELAGGLTFDLPIGRIVARNITPDKETGIGAWTDAQIIAAIREGKRPDGTIIGPPMAIEFYSHISDTDVQAIVAYLRSVKPVRNKLAKSAYKIPLPASYGPPVTHVPDVPRTDKVAYGAYLAGPVGHCMECHTPFDKPGHLDMSRLGAGGRELPAFNTPDGVVISRNVTPDKDTGLGAWSDKEIKTAITKGVRRDGTPLVPTMAFAWYAHIRNDDLDAIVAYLRSLKPVATPAP